MTRFIGDVHGKYSQYKRILKGSPPSIQVGDMGVGFRRMSSGDFYANPPHRYMSEGEHLFIRGNHDNPGECRKHSQWIEDGTYRDGMMFIGGAMSIDREWRVENFSWWADEELSMAELNELVDKYILLKPRVMVTHDCPEEVATEVARASGVNKLDYPSRTRQAFQSMWSSHSPELWIFGHWHHSFDHVLNGTRFICLAELEWIDI